MQLERTKNAKRNFIFGVLYRLLMIILPFILRTIVIKYLGSLYAGATSLFSSILSVLNLAELGIGTSIVYCMYKPIAEGDDDKICALLKLYKKAYTTIGIIILAIGLILTPFVPNLVKGSFPSDLNIYVVFIIQLLSTCVTYFMFAYKSALIEAFQRNDISSITHSILAFLEYIIQIILMIIFHNYYLYLIISPCFNIIYNIIIAIIVNKKYPKYIPKGNLDKEETSIIISKVRSLFIYKIGNVVSNSVDNIFLSAYIGLTTVFMYNNYYYVISSLFTILGVYYSSMLAGLGNKMVLETKEENYNLFNKLFFLQGWIIGWMVTCLLCLFQDFITLWVGEVFTFDITIVILLCIYFYTWKINDIAHTFKDAAGLWEYDRFRPFIASLLNLTINLLLINKIGVAAVIISTISCEITFSLFWGVRILFDKYFNVSFIEYLKKYLLYIVYAVVMMACSYFVCSLLHFNNLLVQLILKGVICVIVPNVLFIIINYHNDNLKWAINEVIIKTLRRNKNVKGQIKE